MALARWLPYAPVAASLGIVSWLQYSSVQEQRAYAQRKQWELRDQRSLHKHAIGACGPMCSYCQHEE